MERRELEIKLRLAEPRSRAAARLRSLGAVLELPRHLEDNYLFDGPEGRIARSGCLLRVRLIGRGALLTYKGPSRIVEGTKARNELETGCSDGETLLKIFARIGMRRGFRYQKYRTLFRRGSLAIALDETPIGNYIEVEGPPSGIERFSKLIGYGRSDFITGTYYDLFVSYKRANRIRGRHMVFGIRAFR